jgi:hypothetical protein
MKNFYTLFCALLVSNFVSAQVVIDCGSNRYDQEIFSAVDTTNNVVYGSNLNYQGATTALTMDIYQPSGDTAQFRPLIVWVHGGSFVGGSKNDNDVTGLCQHFARRGYVCASINYRLGITFPYNQANATNAVFRAVQDMKAAVRFFRQDAATTNTYKIDPDMIFGGGSSAGAFTALHLAYLDQPSELPATIDTVALGGLEGNSGNPGYSSTIRAVLNLCGAMGDTAWMVNGDVPVCSMHGTQDAVVPYSSQMLYLLQIFPIMVVDGSYSVNEHALLTGVNQSMYTYYGADHVPYASNAAYMDTTVRFVSNFLFRYLGCNPADPEPVANTWNTVSVPGIIGSAALNIFPNPAAAEFTVRIAPEETGGALKVFNSLGEVVFETMVYTVEQRVDLNGVPGMYFVTYTAGSRTGSSILILE